MTSSTGDALKASAAQVPVGWLYQFKDEKPIFMPEKRDWAEGHAFWKETPLYAAISPPVEQAPQPVEITESAILAACRAHTPQFDRLDSEIARYAKDQMREALTSALKVMEIS